MKFFAILLLCASGVLASVEAFSFDGPLQVRNQFPILVSMDRPILESADIESAASISLAHSNVYVMAPDDPWTAKMDLELTELDLRADTRIAPGTSVGIEVPFFRPSGGFFDSPLAWWHESLGVGNYGRDARPMNAFLYEITRNGSPVIIGVNDRSAMGDVKLTCKQALVSNGVAVSLLANIELPTGEAKTGYGNGSLDAGLGVLADMRLGEQYKIYANLGAVFPGDLKAYQTISLSNYAYGGIGIEATWWKSVAVLAQVLVEGSPWPVTGIRQIDVPGVLLAFGARYYIHGGSIEFSLTEDPALAGAPDFIAGITFKKLL